MMMCEMNAGRTLDQDHYIRPLVLTCGDVRLPHGLSAQSVIAVPACPRRADVDPQLDRFRRLIVVGQDGDLAAVLTRLLRAERLDIELAYVTWRRSAATRVWSLPTGERAAELAVTGTAAAVALTRDDAGVALVGRAKLSGADGTALTGETYADSSLLFSGSVRRVLIEPTNDGVRALAGRFRPWISGRAVQTGSTGLVLTRDGVEHERVVARSTFYRHSADWLLVR